LIVVMVIIGILAAMAIPRVSRGTAGASETAVINDLAVMRNAIALFAEEHKGKFPPGPTGDDVADQLVQHSDEAGTAVSLTRDSTHRFGPYLVKVPRCSVVTGANAADIAVDATSPPATNLTGEGWVYNITTGEIIANSTATDTAGTAFNTY
jgi:type II secretory pathway pseudopilin PulG